MLIDRAILQVRGGDGGHGVISFRKEKYVPRGGPDGGDGGNGGHVIVKATEGLTNLAHLASHPHWKAERGEHGQSKDCHGARGKNLIITVPPGTIVRDHTRDIVLRDLTEPDEWVVVARGGRGGHGNTHFKSSTNRTPRQRELGQEGQERKIQLELKVIADVGLIGLPNAGKSTLLSRISRARPEIADYPFTTKHPNLGIVNLDIDFAFVVADIPGLIEGAHMGHGLGHEFLRHVERTRVLVHLVEAAPMDGSDPIANYRLIQEELRQYSEELAKRPELVVLTKLDVGDIRERFLQETGVETVSISAVTGKGMPQLLAKIAELLKANPPEAPKSKPAPIGLHDNPPVEDDAEARHTSSPSTKETRP